MRAALLALLLAPLATGGGDPIAADLVPSCAPWDGPAFSVVAPLAPLGKDLAADTLGITIWKSPAIPSRTTFTFSRTPGAVPDSGSAVLKSGTGYERLTGTATFEKVDAESPADGAFDLTAKDGRRFTARFHATWKHMRIFCG